MSLVIELENLPSLFDDITEQLSQVDYTPVMLAGLELLQDGERDAFNAGVNPTTGERWAENAASTIKRKGHGIPLFVTGALEKSLTDESAEGAIREAETHGLLFGTSDAKSLFNQEGTSRIPARPHVGANPHFPDVMAEEVGDFTVEQLVAGNT